MMKVESIVMQSGRVQVKVTADKGTWPMLFNDAAQVRELAEALLREAKRIEAVAPKPKPRYRETELFA